METIQNVATSASKMIFGEQNTTQGNENASQEPISGHQGKGTVDDPYDQGNSENPTTTTNEATLPLRSKPDSTSAMSETTNTPNNLTNAAQGGAPDPLKETDKTGVVAGQPGDATKGKDIIHSESSSNPGAAPSSDAAPEIKQQGADKPKDVPTGEQEGAVKDTKDEVEDIIKKRDPNDHSGEPMRMHDDSEKKIPATQEERRESNIGLPGGQEHGKEPKGTGEEWVKTTGLAADGGDFDATKPGAGREADRLMEEKGTKKTDSNHGPPVESSEHVNDKDKDKVSMKDKIKDKLHIGKH